MPSKVKQEDLHKKASAILSQVRQSEKFLKGLMQSMELNAFKADSNAASLKNIARNLEDYYTRLIGETGWLNTHCSDIHGISKEELLGYLEVSRELLNRWIPGIPGSAETSEKADLIAHADRMIETLNATRAPKETKQSD